MYQPIVQRVGCLIAMGCFATHLTGCSVVMALFGSKVDMSVLHVGSSREEVEAQLGKPVSSTPTNWGAQTDTYAYVAGNERSIGRALSFLLLDILTLFLYEIFFTIGELARGNKERVPIHYGPDGLVAGINETAPDAPPGLPAPVY